MAIEYCKHDEGSIILYAFRHPNVARYSLMVTWSLKAISFLESHGRDGYGGAVSQVQLRWQRGKRGGAFIPMFNLAATPEAILALPGLGDTLRASRDAETTSAVGRIIDALDLMLHAETVDEAVSISGWEDPAGKYYGTITAPLSEHLQTIWQSHTQRERVLIKEEEQYIDDQLSIIDAKRAKLSPDWGTW